MPNLMTRGATWLADRLQAAGGEVVTYKPGNSPEVAITAVLKSTDYRINGEEGFETSIAPFVWLIEASEIGEVRPRAGQRIVRSDGETHVVMQPSDGEQAAMLDKTATLWTVHTKRIKEANG